MKSARAARSRMRYFGAMELFGRVDKEAFLPGSPLGPRLGPRLGSRLGPRLRSHMGSCLRVGYFLSPPSSTILCHPLPSSALRRDGGDRKMPVDSIPRFPFAFSRASHRSTLIDRLREEFVSVRIGGEKRMRARILIRR